MSSIKVEITAPAEFDIETMVGVTFALNVIYTVNGTSTPIDWTGYTFTSKVKTNRSERTPVAATIEVTAPTPTNGTIVLASTDTETLDEGRYVYDIFATIAGASRCIARGAFIVCGSVSQ